MTAEIDLFDEPAVLEKPPLDDERCDVCGLQTAVLEMARWKCPACALELCPTCEKRHIAKYPEHGGQ
jgi:hypothetical protein